MSVLQRPAAIAAEADHAMPSRLAVAPAPVPQPEELLRQTIAGLVTALWLFAAVAGVQAGLIAWLLVP